jgi:plastocyanin
MEPMPAKRSAASRLRALLPAFLITLLVISTIAGRATRAAAHTSTVAQGAVIQVEIADFNFAPLSITVQVGDTVTWTNSDSAQHLVQADNGAFKSDTLQQGDQYTYQATTPGTFTYYCQFHPFMKATLVVEAAGGSRTFPETGQTLQGRFLAYWDAHGGLAINGYPISGEFMETLEDGHPYLVQYFERIRMEYHHENAVPNDVLLGQFGRRIHPADPAVAAQPGATFFQETGHNVSGGFLAYWQANGGLPQFGYPLTEVITETLGDGKSYQVQYFERARFEYHPENAAPYDILLGQFGRQIYEQATR